MRGSRALTGLVIAVLCGLGMAACGSSSSSASKSSAPSSSSNATASSSSTTGSTKSPVTFALISFSVPGENYLGEFSEGASVAVKQIDTMGGFGGRPVNIVQCNSMLQPAAATVCAHRTVVDHPIAMFGCETSWYVSGLPIYAAAHIPSFNCLNATPDFTNPWSFGIIAGGYGQEHAIINYLCSSRPDVKKVVSFGPSFPGSAGEFQTATAAPLKACGKQAAQVIIPLTAVDPAPYVAKVLAQKPDIVIIGTPSGQGVLAYKAFQQAGFPASKTFSVDTNFTGQTTQEAGTAIDGAYVSAQFTPWGATSDPEVAAYIKASKAAGVDPQDATVEWGYADVMFLYTAAKDIGFANFNSASLAHFMDTASGVHYPLSRELVNPGPKGFPQVKQPYDQIMQWNGTGFTVVPTGPGKNGWQYSF